MAKYETISKHLIQTYPKDFIRLTLEQDDVEVLDILDTEQIRVETQHTDSLIRAHIAGKEALIHYKFQTTDDPSMPLRMAVYIIRAIEQHGLPVDESIKVDFLGRLMILSGLEYDPTIINRILSQEGLMDAIMRESSFAQYIKQEGIEEGIE